MAYMHNTTTTTTNHANLSLTLSPRLANLAQLNRFCLGGDTILTICLENIKLRKKVRYRPSGLFVWYSNQT
ncbi:hypothetical protein SO802_002547 [Lithocarpus litseifolius]|uniref:Uncharacterized protein n=1 Tax=Lithocarpus litseifolius TaxID=425828 RepID=A0AAW2E122_9ROSI